jgi:hypothetical protein
MRPTLRGDRNQCPTCNLLFNSSYAFDKHRIGPSTERECLGEEKMREKGMEKNKDGFWIGEPMDKRRLGLERFSEGG